MHRHRPAVLTLALSLALPLGASPLAFTQQPPTDAGGPVVVDPVSSERPGLPSNIVRQDLSPTSSGLIREGAFISEHQGLLRPLKGGGWAFVFDPDADDNRLQPMIIQPGLRLTEMRRLVESSDRTITFRISGRVLVYGSRNYLLPTFYTTVSVGERDTVAPGVDDRTDDPALDEFEELFLETEGDPSLDESIEEVERLDRPNPTSIPRGGGDPEEPGEQTGSAEDEAPKRLIREGVQITARVGRLVRSPGTGWLMSFDNDTDTAADPGVSGDGATLDTPMQMLPCLNLQGMEALAEEYGSRLRFTVSGTVYVYDGRNYLLPTMYIIELDRTGNLIPGQ